MTRLQEYADELTGLINEWAEDADLTIAEVVGMLECEKLRVWQDVEEDEEDEFEWDDDECPCECGECG